jgi:hypothetical protein
LDEEPAETRLASEAFVEQATDSLYDRNWAATQDLSVGVMEGLSYAEIGAQT